MRTRARAPELSHIADLRIFSRYFLRKKLCKFYIRSRSLNFVPVSDPLSDTMAQGPHVLVAIHAQEHGGIGGAYPARAVRHDLQVFFWGLQHAGGQLPYRYVDGPGDICPDRSSSGSRTSSRSIRPPAVISFSSRSAVIEFQWEGASMM